MSDPRGVEQVLAWIRSGKVRPGDDMLPADQQLVAQRAREVQACFRQFPEVLQLIFEATIFRPPVDCNLPDGSYERYAQLRQGQNQVAALLAAYLKTAEDLEELPHALSSDDPTRSRHDVAGDPGTGGWAGLDLDVELAVR